MRSLRGLVDPFKVAAWADLFAGIQNNRFACAFHNSHGGREAVDVNSVIVRINLVLADVRNGGCAGRYCRCGTIPLIFVNDYAVVF